MLQEISTVFVDGETLVLSISTLKLLGMEDDAANTISKVDVKWIFFMASSQMICKNDFGKMKMLALMGAIIDSFNIVSIICAGSHKSP